ncbi:hypothetical protein DFH09DRAFT_1327598 [Mycena vulgaris]|nr:hypothetical protein DFH09DRAFT_1327598 [Mycena vulgaris]
MNAFRDSYVQYAKDPMKLRTVNLQILRYLGQDDDPTWMDVDPGQYSVLCTIRADTSQAAKTLKRREGARGVYYRLDTDVVLSFGLTELKAQIAWLENGIEKRGPATLVY